MLLGKSIFSQVFVGALNIFLPAWPASRARGLHLEEKTWAHCYENQLPTGVNRYFNLVSMLCLDCAQLVSLARPVLSCAIYFQAPVTQAIMAEKY